MEYVEKLRDTAPTDDHWDKLRVRRFINNEKPRFVAAPVITVTVVPPAAALPPPRPDFGTVRAAR
jgi:hypothetical protein